jgi:hypothetical protein
MNVEDFLKRLQKFPISHTLQCRLQTYLVGSACEVNRLFDREDGTNLGHVDEQFTALIFVVPGLCK